MKNILTVLLTIICLNTYAQTLEWEKTLVFDTTNFTIIGGIEELTSGNLFFMGSRLLSPMRLIKCNALGDTIFTRIDSGLVELERINTNDEFYLLRNEGLFFITGSNISRADSNLNINWANQGPLQSHFGSDIIVTNDLGVVETGGYGNQSETFIRKIDQNGNNLWIDSTSIGKSSSGIVVQKVIEMNNGQLVQLSSSGQKMKLTRFEANGIFVDSVTIFENGDAGLSDIAYSTIDDFIYINTSVTIDTSTFEDVIYKFDSNLNQQWKHVKTTAGSIAGIEVTDQGLLITTEFPPPDSISIGFPELLFLDDSVEIGSVSINGIPWSLEYVSNNSCILGGFDTIDAWMAKVSGLVVTLYPDIESFKEHKVFPIPANEKVNFDLSRINQNEGYEITIHSIDGAMKLTKSIENKYLELDVSEYKDGIYVYKINGKEKSGSGKFIIKH